MTEFEAKDLVEQRGLFATRRRHAQGVYLDSEIDSLRDRSGVKYIYNIHAMGVALHGPFPNLEAVYNGCVIHPDASVPLLKTVSGCGTCSLLSGATAEALAKADAIEINTNVSVPSLKEANDCILEDGAIAPALEKVCSLKMEENSSAPSLVRVDLDCEIMKGASAPQLRTVKDLCVTYTTLPKLTSVSRCELHGEGTIVPKLKKVRSFYAESGTSAPVLEHVRESCILEGNTSVPKLKTIGIRIEDRIPFDEEEYFRSTLHSGAKVPSLETIFGSCRIEEKVEAPRLAEVTFDCVVGKGVSLPSLTKVGNKCKVEEGAFLPALTEVGFECTLSDNVKVPALNKVWSLYFKDGTPLSEDIDVRGHAHSPFLDKYGMDINISSKDSILTARMASHNGIAPLPSVRRSFEIFACLPASLKARVHPDINQALTELSGTFGATEAKEVRFTFRSPSGTTLLDDVARIFPDETGREPVRVERLRNGNRVSVYDSFEYDIVGNAIEISSNRVHAVETAPDGQLLGSYFLIGNSYGDLKDGPELSRTGDGWAYRINSAIRTSDEYLSSNSIIFDRDGNLDWEKTEKEKNFNDFYISPEAELAKFNHPRMDTVPFQESVRLLFEKDSSGAMIVNMKDGKALTIDGASAGSEGLYVIKKDGKFNYISEDGNLLLKNWVDSATEYKDGKAKCKLGNATLEIDRTGTLLKKQEISAGQAKGPRNN